MNFRRTTTEQPPTPPAAADRPAKPGGKGRPTPKRSESQKRRAAAAAPTDRKQAVKLQRQEAKALRARYRAAVATGDEKNYPALHFGAERGLVRDLVDSRHSIAWLGLPVVLLTFFTMYVVVAANPKLAPIVNVAFLAIFSAVMLDSFIAWRRIKRGLRERFPTGTKEKTGTLALYGVSRNNQRPGRRKPPRRVKPGDEV